MWRAERSNERVSKRTRAIRERERERERKSSARHLEVLIKQITKHRPGSRWILDGTRWLGIELGRVNDGRNLAISRVSRTLAKLRPRPPLNRSSLRERDRERERLLQQAQARPEERTIIYPLRSPVVHHGLIGFASVAINFAIILPSYLPPSLT